MYDPSEMCPIHLYMEGSPDAAHRVSDDKSWYLSSVRFHLCCSVHTHSLWCDLFDLIRAQPVGGQSIPFARVFPAVTLEDLVIYCKVTSPGFIQDG